jgi:hypothetical protein
MHKSVLTFGLLTSSIVMLAIMPFLNQNNSFFSNSAMAQDYDDSYSQYPTDDKKYECRTGPLQGIFVSSVEFCKFNKFDKDDRKDNNRTGTQGPPGPPGPPGPQVQQVHREFKVYLVLQEQLEQLEQLDLQELLH